jgi:hypothetical protein
MVFRTPGIDRRWREDRNRTQRTSLSVARANAIPV